MAAAVWMGVGGWVHPGWAGWLTGWLAGWLACVAFGRTRAGPRNPPPWIGQLPGGPPGSWWPINLAIELD